MSTCNQFKCAYRIYGGCKPCKDCGAEPSILDDNCSTCWNCSKDEGILRWDDGDDNELSEDDSIKNKKDEIKQELKPIEVKVKTK